MKTHHQTNSRPATRILTGSIAAVCAVALLGGSAAHADNGTWLGTTDAVWATSTNWSSDPNPVPGTGNTATFDNAGGGFTTIDLGGGVLIGTILFDSASAAAYTIGSGAVNSQSLTLDNSGAVTMNAAVAGNELFNASVALGTATAGTYTFTNDSTTNTLTFAGDVQGGTGGTAAAKTLTVTGSGHTAISGIVANGGATSLALTKTGTGVLTLSNANTYSGVTTVSGGVLRLDHVTALPGGIGTAGGTSALTFSGGVLGLGNGDFTRSLGTAGTVTAVNFTGAGGWAAYGADRVVNLGGAAASITWATANTGFNNQTLILGAASATHMVDLQNALVITTARTVQVDDGAAAVDAKLSGLISGVSGGITKTGLGTLLLSNTGNSYTGTTIVNAGTLRTSASNVLPNASAVTVSGTGAGVTATLDLDGNSDTIGTLSFGGSTATSGAAVTTGAGTLTLGGNITYSATNNPLGATLSGNLALGATRVFTIGNSSSTTEELTVSALVSGATFGITKDGAGTLVLSNSGNSYTGNTSLTNNASTGIIRSGADNVLPNASTLVPAGNGTIDLAGFSDTVNGTGGNAIFFALNSVGQTMTIATGAGTLTIGGNIGQDSNGFGTKAITGNLNLGGATRTIQANGGLLDISAIVSNGGFTNSANLRLSGANIFAGGISLTGNTTQMGIDPVGTVGAITSSALGTGTLTFAGGTLSSDGVTPRTVLNAVTFTGNGGAGNVTNNGKVTFSADMNLGNAARTFTLNSDAQFDGAMIGGSSGSVTTAGSGVLTLNNATDTWGGMTAGGTSTIKWSGNNQLLSTAAVGAAGNGTLDLNGNSDTVGRIGFGTGSVGQTSTIQTGAGTLTITGAAGGNGNIAVDSGSAQAKVISGNLSLGGGVRTIENGSAGSFTISAVVSNGGLTQTNGTILYTGDSTYASATTLTGGTFQIGGGNVGTVGAITSSPLGTGTLTFNNGTLSSDSTTARTILNPVTFTNNGTVGNATNNGLLTFSADVNLNGTRTVTVNSEALFDGILSNGGITKIGTATLLFGGANSYSGATTVNVGTLRSAANDVLPDGSAITVSGNAAGVTPGLDLDGFSDTIGTLTFGGSTTTSGSSVTTGAGTLTLGANVTYSATNNPLGGTLSGNVALSGIRTFTIGDSTTTVSDLTVSAAISGVGGGLIKAGLGTLVLSGTNTYDSTTTVNAGILRFAQQVALYNNVTANWTDTNIVVNSGGTAAFNVGGGAGEFTAADILTLSALGTGSGGFLSGSSIGLDTTNAGGTFTYSNIIADPNAGANALGVTKLGTGVLILDQANTYTGTTTVIAGTLRSGADDVLPDASNVVVNSDTPGATARLDLNGFNDTIGSLTFGGATAAPGGVGAVTTGAGTLTLGGNVTFTSTNNPAAASISGNLDLGAATRTFTINDSTATQEELAVSAVISGTGVGLSKAGTGSLTLSAANTFDGGISLSAGTLNINNASALGVTAGTFTITGGTIGNTTGADLTVSTNNAQAWNGNFTYAGAAGDTTPGASLDLGTGTVTLSAARTVTVSNNTLTVGGAITGAGLNALNITKAGAGTLVLSADAALTSAQTITVNAGTMTLGGVFSGGFGFFKAGAGTLALTNAGNTFGAGTITINAGLVSATSDGALGDSGNIISLNANGAGLQADGTFSTARQINTSVAGGVIAVTQGNTLTVSTAFNGGAASAIAFTKNNNGILEITADNNGGTPFTGVVTVNAGALRVSNAGALGAAANNTVVANSVGAAVQINGVTVTELFTINSTGLNTGGAIENVSGSGAVNGAITLASAATIGSTSGTLDIGGTISGAFGLTFVGAGNINLNTALNANVTSITKIGAGTTTIAVDNSANVAAITVNAGTFQVGSTTTGVGKTNGNLTVNPGATLKVDNTFAGTGNRLGGKTLLLAGGTLDFIGHASTATTEAVGALTFGGAESTVKSTFNGANSFVTFTSNGARPAGGTRNYVLSGGVNGTSNQITLTGQALGFIDQGSFFGGNAYAYMNAAGTFVRGGAYGTDAGFVTSAGGATLAAATHQQITGAVTAQNTAVFTTFNISGNNNLTLASGQTVTTNGLLKTGNVAGGATISGGTGLRAANNAEMVIRTDGTDDTLTISTPIIAQGANALTKTGLGTVTLSGVNTYTGQTTINQGTLALSGGNNRLAVNKPLVVNKGGTFALGANNQYVGNLSGTGSVEGSGGSITGSGILTVNQANAFTFAGDIAGSVNFVKAGSAVLTLSSAQSTTGAISVIGGGVTLIDGGTLLGTTGGIVLNGATLTISNTGTKDIADRVNGSAITLNSGGIIFNGRAQSNSTETLGAVTASTGSSILSAVVGGTGVNSAQVNLTSLTRNTGASILLNQGQTNLGQTGNSSRVVVSGGLSGNLAPVNGVVPGVTYMVNTDSYHFVGYAPGLGFGQLGTTGFPGTTATFIGAVATDNVTDANGTIVANQTINSFKQGNLTFPNGTTTGGSDLLTIASGMTIMNTVTWGTTTQRGRITSGTQELVIFKRDANVTPDPVVNTVITDNDSPVSLVVQTARADRGPYVILTAPNNYTGGTYVNSATGQGGIELNATTAGTVVIPAGGLTINNNSVVDMVAFEGQIHSSNVVTINGGGMLRLMGTNTLAGLVFNSNGGTIAPTVIPYLSNTLGGNNSFAGFGAKTGTLIITGNITSTPSNVAVTPLLDSGTLNLSGGQRTITVHALTEFSGTNGTTIGQLPVGLNISSVVTNGGINKEGLGVLQLSGANGTYTGATNVNDGVLVAGAANAFGNGTSALTVANLATASVNLQSNNTSVGSIAGGGALGGNIIASGGTLTTGGDNTSTSYAGKITTSGGLTKAGTGTQTLTGINTVSGNTFVNGGGGVTVNGVGASLVIGSQFTLGSTAAAGNTLIISGGATMSVGGNFWTGGGAGNPNNGQTNNTLTITGAGSMLTLSATYDIADRGTNNFNILSGGVVNSPFAYYAFFAEADNNAILVDGAGSVYNFGGMDMAVTNGATGNTITVSNAGIVNTTGSVVISSNTGSNNNSITITGASSAWNFTSGTAGSRNLTISNNGATGNSFNVSSGGALTNVNTLTVGGTNSALNVGNGTGTSTAAANTVTLGTASSRLNFNSGRLTALATGAMVSGTGEIVLNGPAYLSTSFAGSTITSGKISGTGTLTKEGTGALLLNNTATNTYSGDTIITDGTLQIGRVDFNMIPNGASKGNVVLDGGASTAGILNLNNFSETINGLSGTTGTVLGQVVNNTAGTKTLTVGDGNATASFAGIIATGTGNIALTKIGTGTQTLSGTNTYTGVTTVSGGVLRLEAANALPGGTATTGGTSNLTFNGGVVGLGSGNSSFTRSLNTAATVDAATFAGAGGWAAYGANATVDLGGAAALVDWGTADTGFNSQTLILGASTADALVTVSNPIDLGTAGRTIQVDNGSAVDDGKMAGTITGTFVTNIGDSGGLTKTGGGALRLDGDQSYKYLTANAGTTNVNGALTTLTAVVAVNNSGTTLRFGSVSQTLSSLTIGAGSTVVFTSGAASGSLAGGGGGKAPSFGGGSAVVPEPGTLGLLLVGALGLLNRRRRQA